MSSLEHTLLAVSALYIAYLVGKYVCFLVVFKTMTEKEKDDLIERLKKES